MNEAYKRNITRCIIGTLICHLALAAFGALVFAIVPQYSLLALILGGCAYIIFFAIGWRLAAQRGLPQLIEGMPIMLVTFRNYLLAQLGALLVLLTISRTFLGDQSLLNGLGLLIFGAFFLLFSAILSSTSTYILLNQRDRPT